MPEPFLDGAGILAVVGEGEPAGVPEHVRVDGEGEAGRLADRREQLAEAGRRHRRLALGGEH